MPWRQVSNLSKQIAESKTKDGNDPERQLIPAPPSPDDAENQAEPESESASEDEALDSYDPRACDTKQIYGGNPDHQDYRRTLRYFTNNAEIHVQPKTSIFDAPPKDSTHTKSPRSQMSGYFLGGEPPRLPTPDPIFATDDWGNMFPDHLRSDNEIAEGMKDIAKDKNAALGGAPVRTISPDSNPERAQKPQPQSASSEAGGAAEATNSDGDVTDAKIGEMEDWLAALEKFNLADGGKGQEEASLTGGDIGGNL
ncbi:MAG: hypothetical protein ASARMPRED_003118 [Alectoria sarmentosa]|nr:MAG: hypothetical protein ASARMPRED_003118 [Alectoria sarmentosa]